MLSRIRLTSRSPLLCRKLAGAIFSVAGHVECIKFQRVDQLRSGSTQTQVIPHQSQTPPPSQLWHKLYSSPQTNKDQFSSSFRALDICHSPRAIGYLASTSRSLRTAKDPEKALEYWQLFLQYVSQRLSTENGSSISANPHDPLQPSMFPRKYFAALRQILDLNLFYFDKFWEPMTSSPLVIEAIPEAIRFLCSQKKYLLAHQLLLHMSDESLYAQQPPEQQVLYQNGLNSGLNTLLHGYCLVREADSGISSQWSQMYEILSDFDANIPIRLVPRVTSQLAQRIPRNSLVDFYKLFLTRKVDMKSHHMTAFVKAVMASSDAGRLLVIDSDKLWATESRELSSDTSPVSPLFAQSFYDYLFRVLARSKDSARTAWFLENFILANTKSVTDMGSVLKLLMIRAVEIDGMPTASVVFNTMLSKEVEPSAEIFAILCRGFRLHGQEAKCYEVIEKMLSSGMKLKLSNCVELLTLISSVHGPDEVLRYYLIMNPEHATIIEQLGLTQFQLQIPNAAPSSQLHLLPENVEISDQCLDSMLSLVYKSVLSEVTNVEDICSLYRDYRAFALSHQFGYKPTVGTVDWFVRALCRVPTQRSIDAAYDLFIDAIESLPLHQSLLRNRTCHSAKLLCRAYCLRSPGSGVEPNISKATDLVRLVHRKNILPVTRGLLEPIVRYYRLQGYEHDAEEWTKHAAHLGATI